MAKDIEPSELNFISDEAFNKAVVDCLNVNNLTPVQLAVKIQMNLDTVNNWINKKSYPLPIMRKSVLVALEKVTHEKKV